MANLFKSNSFKIATFIGSPCNKLSQIQNLYAQIKIIQVDTFFDICIYMLLVTKIFKSIRRCKSQHWGRSKNSLENWSRIGKKTLHWCFAGLSWNTMILTIILNTLFYCHSDNFQIIMKLKIFIPKSVIGDGTGRI